MNPTVHTAANPQPIADKLGHRWRMECVIDPKLPVVQVDTLTLDASKPTTVPGALTTTIRSHKRTNRCEYNILYVPRLQAFQIECLHANGDVEFPFIFEHLAIQWIPTGYTKEALALAKKGQAA